jgi:hypothetical protein
MSYIAAEKRERARGRTVVFAMAKTSHAAGTQARGRRAGRAAAVATAVVCMVAAAPAGAADKAPDKLLRAYPLEQRPTTVAAGQRRPAAAARPSGTSEAPRLTQGAAIVIAGGAMLLAALVVTRRGRRPAPAGFTMAAAAPTAAEAPPAPLDEPPAAAPAPRRAALPAAAAKDGVVCQVRWLHEADTAWFAAITVRGSDRRVVAESPDFDSDRRPPDRTPEAQEALRVLVDELCESGWTPVRGRGRESGAPRWYARRFHSATDLDTDTEET